MFEDGPFSEARRAADLQMALAMTAHLEAAGAGAEQLQLRNIRRHAGQAALAAPSAVMRGPGAHGLLDGVDMVSPVAWPHAIPAPVNRLEGNEPLVLPPSPIAASPAGWDGESSLHQPYGTRWGA